MSLSSSSSDDPMTGPMLLKIYISYESGSLDPVVRYDLAWKTRMRVREFPAGTGESGALSRFAALPQNDYRGDESVNLFLLEQVIGEITCLANKIVPGRPEITIQSVRKISGVYHAFLLYEYIKDGDVGSLGDKGGKADSHVAALRSLLGALAKEFEGEDQEDSS